MGGSHVTTNEPVSTLLHKLVQTAKTTNPPFTVRFFSLIGFLMIGESLIILYISHYLFNEISRYAAAIYYLC